jgi:hypothetical protein
MCELGLFVTIEAPAGTGGCFVTITLDDGQVVASDRIECKGEALGFCAFVICAMRLHDPGALIVVDVGPAGDAVLSNPGAKFAGWLRLDVRASGDYLWSDV